MNLDNLYISDYVSASALFSDGRKTVEGTIVNILDNGIVVIDTGDSLVGCYAEDVAEVIDHDDECDPFRNDVEADADALASAGLGTDEDYEHETPIGEELDGGSSLED